MSITFGKTALLTLVCCLLGFSVPIAFASSLSCNQIDGGSIFGWDSDKYIYLGSIANQYNSDSIANAYGHYGNKYSSDSIFNTYGSFGSEYGSYSASNDYSSTPPIVVDDDDEFVGYLTTNTIKSPSISPWEAYACALDSYKSTISGHENITFLDIPDSSSNTYNDLLLNYYLQQSDDSTTTNTFTCSDYQYTYTGSDGLCYCNLGYAWSDATSTCIENDLDYLYCETIYGEYSYYDESTDLCSCESGYSFDSKDQCILTADETIVESDVSSNTSDLSTITQTTSTNGSFPDTNGHWAAEYIDELVSQSVVSGYDNGNFGPDDSLTRAQMAKIAVLALGLELDSSYDAGFADVDSSAWYSSYVNTAAKNGVVGGYTDTDGVSTGYFGPDDTVNRAQAAKILVNAAGLSTDTSGAPHFDDVASGDWYYDFVETAFNNSLVSGYTNGNFGSNDPVTRGQISKMTVNAQS